MSLFWVLMAKICPLYFNIGLGYLAARCCQVDRTAIAALLFYIISPLVVFSAVLSVRIDPGVALLPVFFYLLCSLIAVVGAKVFRPHWPDSTGNILAFTAGTGNSGYFGIALAVIIFPPAVADIFIFTVLASFFYESTVGFYIAAKGSFTPRQSLGMVARLPVLYAFVLGLACNLGGIVLPELLLRYSEQFKAIYSILGMMVIGMGLDGLRQGGGMDRLFMTISLGVKHLLWPLLIFAVILLDRVSTHLLSPNLHIVMFVFSIVPMAGNTVTLAILVKARPEKAALAVMLSTLLAIVTVPFMITAYLHFFGGEASALFGVQ
ncbi:MAG: AEC family transporter [Desulfopila sp.]